MDDVFRGSEAVRQGKLSPYRLRTEFRAIYPDIYVPQWTTISLRMRSEAAWLWSGRRGVLAGLAAAALHGSDWVDEDEPIELIWRNQHAPGGVVTRNQCLRGDETTRVAGLPVTTPTRTAFDLARLLPAGDAVARLDALMRATPFCCRRCVAARQAALRRARPAATENRASAGRPWRRIAQERRGSGCC